MRLTIRPVQDPGLEIDVTRCLVSAIAEELWRLFGGNGELNWLEAELHLGRIIAEARAEARAEADETESPRVAPHRALTTRAETVTGRPAWVDHSGRPSLGRTTARRTRVASLEAERAGRLPHAE